MALRTFTLTCVVDHVLEQPQMNHRSYNLEEVGSNPTHWALSKDFGFARFTSCGPLIHFITANTRVLWVLILTTLNLSLKFLKVSWNACMDHLRKEE